MYKEADTKQLNRSGKKRMANLELLRIFSMMLVVTLHFLGKGDNLPGLAEEHWDATGYAAWGLESLAIVAVNVYMLISGYFLIESSFKVKRLLQLLLQICFYSFGVAVIAALFGYMPAEGFTLYYLQMILLPVSMHHYWFMTAYVYMYVFSPLISAGIKQLSKKQLQVVIVLLLAIFSAMKSVAPVILGADMNGYDFDWYLCVFVIAAYIRLYGIPFFKNKRRSLFVYLLSAAGIFGVTMGIRFVYFKRGNLATILSICYTYNHILVLMAAVGLFYLFYHMRLKEGVFSRIVCTIAPYTLGVYLWHENVAIRYEWVHWLYNLTGQPNGIPSLLILTVLAVAAIFIIGILLDMLRSLCFKIAHRLLSFSGCYRRLQQWLDGLTIGEGKGCMNE